MNGNRIRALGGLIKEFTHSTASGQITAAIGSLVTGIVLLFIGLFMVDLVDQATNLSAGSSFLGVRTSLINTASNVFSAMGIALIVVALALAIQALRNVTSST